MSVRSYQCEGLDPEIMKLSVGNTFRSVARKPDGRVRSNHGSRGTSQPLCRGWGLHAEQAGAAGQQRRLKQLSTGN